MDNIEVTLQQDRRTGAHVATVQKRDGRIVAFDQKRIDAAIMRAFQAVGQGKQEERARTLGQRVSELLLARSGPQGHPQVEQIQDIVEEVLILAGEVQVAKAYILYRHQRSQVRDTAQLLLDGMKLVDDYVDRADWRVSENANMNYSLQGLNFYVASSIAARYWLNKIYPAEVRRSHVEGDFHLHDLGMLATYCCGWDLQDLLMRGFGGVRAKLESKPPRHLRTALGQLVNFFYTVQGESAGAQAISNFDTLLAPFVRYDRLSYAAVKQAIQEFVFNINVPTRVGFQTPFTNLTLDLTPPSTLADSPVIIGGEPCPETYAEFQEEMDWINSAFAEVLLEGDAKGRVFTFPIPTYNITPEFNWGNPVLEPLWQVTAKYGIPYFANFINSDMKPEDARSMCCRLRLDNRALRKRGGGLFGANPLTGSIGVVTINLPRIGYRATSESDFYHRLEHMMQIAKTSLEIKRKVLVRHTEQGLYPYSRHYLKAIHERFGSYWANHFSTIGIVGMNECCLNFLGVDIGHHQGRRFAVQVLEFMRAKLELFQGETGHLYNLEATPAESASYRLAKADRSAYPDVLTAGTSETPYYTNSTHLPVGFTNDLLQALEHQDDLQLLYTGGTVFHAFIGERIDDWRQARLLVQRVAERFHLPYFTLTPTFSVCPVHGYLPGEHRFCPYEHSEGELQRWGVPAR
jgi:anaerobic ribonucleoside-triphosphate reductase